MMIWNIIGIFACAIYVTSLYYYYKEAREKCEEFEKNRGY